METCIFCDSSKIGTLDYVTSVESGMKNVKISIGGLGLFSIEDGPDMEVDKGAATSPRPLGCG